MLVSEACRFLPPCYTASDFICTACSDCKSVMCTYPWLTITFFSVALSNWKEKNSCRQSNWHEPFDMQEQRGKGLPHNKEMFYGDGSEPILSSLTLL